jgi:hypothetical protein
MLNKTAQIRVSASPRLNSEPLGDVNIYKPIATKTTPIIFPIFGALRSIKSWNIGVKTTINPVMNADFDAVVNFIPTVCSINPKKSNTPRTIPLTTPSFEIARSLRKKYKAKRIEAAKKRRATYTKGDASLSMNLVRTNVLPHIIVNESKYDSARVLDVNCMALTGNSQADG